MKLDAKAIEDAWVSLICDEARVTPTDVYRLAPTFKKIRLLAGRESCLDIRKAALSRREWKRSA